MLPKVPFENKNNSDNCKDLSSSSSQNNTSIIDFSKHKEEQLRKEAKKRVHAAAKNLSW